MFERFTVAARDVVVRAQEVARERGDRTIGTLHLLHGVVATQHELTKPVLADHGIDVERIWASAGASDAAALQALGIDVEQVVTTAERSFGRGALSRSGRSPRHIPLTEGSKTTFELALREALRRKDKHIGPEHVLLALERRGGPAAVLLDEAGLDRDRLQAAFASTAS